MEINNCGDCGVEEGEIHLENCDHEICPYCNKCFYKKASKQHKKGERRMLIQKLSNNPTCKNLGGFKKRDGESRHSRNT